jgi:hypothetical protein
LAFGLSTFVVEMSASDSITAQRRGAFPFKPSESRVQSLNPYENRQEKGLVVMTETLPIKKSMRYFTHFDFFVKNPLK